MLRALILLTVLATTLLIAGCGCVPEADPNLREIPSQGRSCGPYGVSPTVPHKIEGGHGWR